MTRSNLQANLLKTLIMDIIKHAPSNKSDASSNFKKVNSQIDLENKYHVNTLRFLKSTFAFVTAFDVFL